MTPHYVYVNITPPFIVNIILSKITSHSILYGLQYTNSTVNGDEKTHSHGRQNTIVERVCTVTVTRKKKKKKLKNKMNKFL